MRIIRDIVKDIECNIREAEGKISTAYALIGEHPQEAAWYRDMAASHLAFNAKGHELVRGEIERYRASEHFKAHPEYAQSMMAVWNDRHAEIAEHSARVRSMVDSLK